MGDNSAVLLPAEEFLDMDTHTESKWIPDDDNDLSDEEQITPPPPPKVTQSDLQNAKALKRKQVDLEPVSDDESSEEDETIVLHDGLT